MADKPQQMEVLNPHSVEISRGSTGTVSISVKVYASTPEIAQHKAQEIFGQLVKRYPYSKP